MTQPTGSTGAYHPVAEGTDASTLYCRDCGRVAMRLIGFDNLYEYFLCSCGATARFERWGPGVERAPAPVKGGGS